MIFQQLKIFFALAIWCAIGTSCISVNLSQDPLFPSDEVSYEAPSHPFREIISPSADKTWKSQKTGNAITFISECGSLGKINLKESSRTSLRSQGIEISSQEEKRINKFHAVESRGKQKNGDIHVELITFQSKNCLFNIAYLGPQSNLEKERAVFEKFRDSFAAP